MIMIMRCEGREGGKDGRIVGQVGDARGMIRSWNRNKQSRMQKVFC